MRFLVCNEKTFNQISSIIEKERSRHLLTIGIEKKIVSDISPMKSKLLSNDSDIYEFYNQQDAKSFIKNLKTYSELNYSEEKKIKSSLTFLNHSRRSLNEII